MNRRKEQTYSFTGAYIGPPNYPDRIKRVSSWPYRVLYDYSPLVANCSSKHFELDRIRCESDRIHEN
jgi:hypothetical protein